MSDNTSHDQFVCPECRGQIPLDPEIRRALVTHGCVLCGSAVTADAFIA